MLETNPEEAFLVFEKWRSDNAVVLCMSSLFGWGFVFKGRVSSIDRDRALLVSLDGAVSLTLPFREDDMIFGYSESGEANLPEGTPGDISALIVSLPLRFRLSEFSATKPPIREKLFFTQLPNEFSTHI